MDIIKILKAVKEDVKRLKGYKSLSLPIAIFYALLLLPMIVSSIALYVVLVIIGTLFKFSTLIRDYLLNFLQQTSKKDDVHHATQAVAYFVGYPLVFTLSLPVGVLCLVNSIIFFIFQCVLYIASVGGTNFQPFLLDYDASLNDKKEVKKQHNVTQIVFISIIGILIVIGLALLLASSITHTVAVDLERKGIELLTDVNHLEDAKNYLVAAERKYALAISYKPISYRFFISAYVPLLIHINFIGHSIFTKKE